MIGMAGRVRNRRCAGAPGGRWRAVVLALGSIAFSGAQAVPAASADLAAGARVQSGAGYDSNVFEVLETKNRTGDAFLRFMAEARLAARRLPGNVRGEVVGRVLTESYDQEPTEDRRQGEVTGSLGLSDGRGTRRVVLEGGVRGRDYRASALRNHRRAWGRMLSSVPVGPTGVLSGRFDLWTLDFRRTARRDRTGGTFDLSYEYPTASRWVLIGGVELGAARHGVASIQLERDHLPGEPESLVEGPDRDDHSRLVHVGVRRVGRVLARAQYGFRSQSSNSIDGEYRRHEISWLLSTALPWGRVHAQFYGNRGHTSYTNPALDRYFVPRVGDIEAGEDDNTMALRLSREILRGWSVDLRAAWYRNESLLVGDYYDKTVAAAGIAWEGGGLSGF